MKIIDTHLHVLEESKDLKYAEKMVKSNVIDKAFLLSTHSITFKAKDDDVLNISKEFPDFFVPFAHLDFLKPASHIDDLKEKGFVGLKAIFPPKPYDDESFFPLYERAEKNNMPIVFHAAGAAYWDPKMYKNVEKDAWGGRYMHVYCLDLIAKLFPDLIIIAAHLGAPWHSEAINVIAGHPNVYADISDGFLISNIDVALKAFHHPKLENKIMFGGDVTIVHIERLLKQRHFWELLLEQNVRIDVYEKVMGLNAQKILDSVATKNLGNPLI